MTPEESLIIQTAKVSDTVLAATQSLIKYLEGHVTKTEVINQLNSINTPDVRFVVEAIQVLDNTLQGFGHTDLTEITGVMREILIQVEQIPKQLPEDKTIDYSADLKRLEAAIKAGTEAVKAQKLVAEAPVVNVPETKVHVDAPDLKPVTKASQDVEKAVKLTTKQVTELSHKTQSSLITEAFDEYKIVYNTKFDDDEETRISSIKYLNQGKVVATLKYTYDKDGLLVGGKRV